MTIRGVYAGSPAGVSAFEDWLGGSIGRAHCFIPRASLNDMTGSRVLPGWANNWPGRVMFTLPMLPNDPKTSMQAAANGAYDPVFDEFGRNLKRYGFAAEPVRIGHEPNGGWFRWSAEPNPNLYRNVFVRIATRLRMQGYIGPIIFSPAAPYQNWDSTLCVPDAHFFDRIYVDAYDTWWGQPNKTPAERLAHIFNAYKTGGVEFWRFLAETLSKAFGFAEWGLVNKSPLISGGGGGGDDVPYIQKMYDYTQQYCEAEHYLNADPADGQHRLDIGHFPQAATRYRELWVPRAA